MQGSLQLRDGFLACPHRFLWHPATRTVVLADVHLGAEIELARQGLYLPDTSTAAITRAWIRLASLEPAHIIIAGDLFDSPHPPPAAVDTFHALLNLLPRDCAITFLPGNHDPSPVDLALLFQHPRLTITPGAGVAGYAVFHGHHSADARGTGEGSYHGPPGDSQKFWIPKGFIVGHQHPAVTLATRIASAKMICFALAKLSPSPWPETLWQPFIPLIILPAFSPLPLGSNLLTDRNWILDLPRPRDQDVQIAGIVERIGEGQVLDFGTLSELMK